MWRPPLLVLVPDWAAYLAADLEVETLETLRRYCGTGRPLGAEPFLKRLEKRLGRPLALRQAGRKPKAGQATGGGGKRPK